MAITKKALKAERDELLAKLEKIGIGLEQDMKLMEKIHKVAANTDPTAKTHAENSLDLFAESLSAINETFNGLDEVLA